MRSAPQQFSDHPVSHLITGDVMNSRSFFLFTLVLLCGCANKSGFTLTEADKNKVMEDIRSEIAGLSQGAESLNTAMAMALYSDSPEFRFISTDGSLADYSSFYRSSDEFFKSCSSVKFTRLQDEFTFLTDDLVIYSWIYRARAVSKSGERYNYDKIGATFLFRRVDQKWKTIYLHESAGAPIITTGN